MLTRILLDSNGQDLAVEHIQDVEPILEANKLKRTVEQRGDFREIADIPNVILVRWINEEHARGNTTVKMLGEEMNRIVAKKLRDPEWAYLRTDKKNTIINGFLGFGS